MAKKKKVVRRTTKKKTTRRVSKQLKTNAKIVKVGKVFYVQKTEIKRKKPKTTYRKV